ncbi:unnamed protein product [Acanthoscelides obtectus]|uniref:Uncharacterized protein n=1 Tax=Acanthoscelides obtectus TaxID=200917 RepID=A0A9P0KGD2_ACAOB|nr:unnamed protein product [Acanthoscelides obtectus]CAK1632477.1 hypothetical protein AOBTE_LOCUS7592 [Acanthoscelides obtectus]
MIRNVKLDDQTDSSLIDNFISANDLDGFDASDIKFVVKLKSAVKDHHNLVLEDLPSLRKCLVDKGFHMLAGKNVVLVII